MPGLPHAGDDDACFAGEDTLNRAYEFRINILLKFFHRRRFDIERRHCLFSNHVVFHASSFLSNISSHFPKRERAGS